MIDDEQEPGIAIDPRFGFCHLDPLPATSELERFYESAYIDLVRKRERFPELGRILAGGPEAEEELAWVRSTMHADLLDSLARNSTPGTQKTLVDVGCGTGELVASASRVGWDAMGLEPSAEASEIGRAAGRRIVTATFDEFMRDSSATNRPMAITLTNVLEHVRDPVGVLRSIYDFVLEDGLVAIRVPNDFNPLQAEVVHALGHRHWWVAAPDHINYFNHETLARTVEGVGFTICDLWADFPMELLVLMGDDYIRDPESGRIAHERRRRFESSISDSTRRAFGRALVPLGWGRNTHLVARRPVSTPT